MKVAENGTAYARGICFQTSRDHVGQRVYVVYETDGVMFFDDRGTLIAEYPWPAPGTRYVGSGKPPRPTAQDPPTVTDVLTHEVSPMS